MYIRVPKYLTGALVLLALLIIFFRKPEDLSGHLVNSFRESIM